ncbi:MAG: bacteriohemerythrin [Terracidiphilus sp.]|nr:bacteriohemerythrin [Terracidiphilus sp.]
MALITWSDEYSVNLKAVDDQHKYLIGILNELHEAMMKGRAQSTTGDLLHQLADYKQTHFVMEERFMERAGFPGLAAHRTCHEELSLQIDEYMQRFQRGEVALDLESLHFLRDWVGNHMVNEDREFSQWLHEHGVH